MYFINGCNNQIKGKEKFKLKQGKYFFFVNDDNAMIDKNIQYIITVHYNESINGFFLNGKPF